MSASQTSHQTMPSALRYKMSFLSPASHEIDVEMSIPDLQLSELQLSLPAWIPGSYMIRDFARHLIELTATDETGHTLTVTKLDKQRWRVNEVNGSCYVRYRIFAFDLSVRSAFFNDEYAFVNGTSVFLRLHHPTELRCELSINTGPFESDSVVTSMLYDEFHRCYRADSYDDLIDHPIFLGKASRIDFTVSDVRFTLLMSGAQRVDIERIAKDLMPICHHHISMFAGDAPFTSYLFITLLASSGYGGLEHRHSTALLFPRDDLPWINEAHNENTAAYRAFLGLCSHELFHAWHVKRTQPAVMQHPALLGEVYTPQLWLYEGVTSYYDDLAVARCGLMTPQQYLQGMAQTLTRVVNTPGNARQSIAESSFDAWTKFYKQDTHSINHIVSYYTQGSIVAFALDLWLRQNSAQVITLDTLMQALWQQYGRVGRGTDDDVIETLCREHFSLDVSDFINTYVYGRQLPPLELWLSTIGLKLCWRPRVGLDDKGGSQSDTSSRYDFGASTKTAEMGVIITQVLADRAAAQAGLFVDDRLIAINDEVVSEKRLQRHLDSLEKSPTLSIVRDGRLLSLTLPLLPAEKNICYFDIEDQQRFEGFLLRSDNTKFGH